MLSVLTTFIYFFYILAFFLLNLWQPLHTKLLSKFTYTPRLIIEDSTTYSDRRG